MKRTEKATPRACDLEAGVEQREIPIDGFPRGAQAEAPHMGRGERRRDHPGPEPLEFLEARDLLQYPRAGHPFRVAGHGGQSAGQERAPGKCHRLHGVAPPYRRFFLSGSLGVCFRAPETAVTSVRRHLTRANHLKLDSTTVHGA